MTIVQNDRSYAQVLDDAQDGGLDFSDYYRILKKRIFYIIVPFVLVLAGGTTATLLWPPTYLSEGKILVESQQVPVDLVKPTVTATAQERIQVIEQRVLTRDNLLTIMDKYQIYGDRRSRLSRTELLDLMRQNTQIKPVELDPQLARNGLTVALTVGFNDQRPDVAMKVANDLITLFLNEDARNRTNRAMETTKFLAREVQRLEKDLGAIDAKIYELKRKQVGLPAEHASPQLAALKSELAAKSAVYSNAHPEVIRLKRQIAALEKMSDDAAAPPAAVAQAGSPVAMAEERADALDALQSQRTSAQKDLDSANQKLTAARLGENLERDQFSERLEVLEQAVIPQKPIKPNRSKFLALAFLAAVVAGFGGVFAIESFDRTIRGSRDLMSIAGGHLIVAIPYIDTKAELLRNRKLIQVSLILFGATVLVGLALVHILVRPLDELWTILMARLGV